MDSGQSHAAAFQLYISIIWWLNGIVGPLLILAWLNDRYRYLDRIDAWAKRLSPPSAHRTEGEGADQGPSPNAASGRR